VTQEERTLAAYRMSRAHETLEEAKVLFAAGHINAYVNCLYYACFYALSALLLTRGFSTSKHAYLRSLFHHEFVKTGLVAQEWGRHFDLLFSSRQEGDYADFACFEAAEVEPWLERTRGFMGCVEKLLSDCT